MGACYDGFDRFLLEWLEDAASYRMFIEPLRLNVRHDDVELYIRTLLAGASLAKEKYGVQTIVPYLRAEGYLRATEISDDTVIARLREGGAIVIDASLAKEDAGGALISIPGDVHPTPFAHHTRAVLLKDYIDRQMPGILRAAPQ